MITATERKNEMAAFAVVLVKSPSKIISTFFIVEAKSKSDSHKVLHFGFDRLLCQTW